MPEYFTLGHSNQSAESFLDILLENRIDLLVDVRRLPGSRRCPWFDQEQLEPFLAEHGIGYQHIVGLTGRRPNQKDVPDDVNAFWENRSFHNYADYALSQEFTDALDVLLTIDAKRPAIMCSEAVWWRCHRRIVADHLLAQGRSVTHVTGKGQAREAELTAGAVVDDGRVTYPASD